MRSVLDSMMDYIFRLYVAKANELGFDKIMKLSKEELQKEFTLDYKKLYNYVVDYGTTIGKPREKISYDVLKLRRLIAMWDKRGVISVEGGVSYMENDVYGSFPVFVGQQFTFEPTPETVDSIISKTVDTFIESYNHKVNEMRLDSKYRIRNLRDLRNALIKVKKLKPEVATEVARIYGKNSSKLEVYDFSKNSIKNF